MELNYFREVSLINYPNKISSVLFAQGCNLDCFYCYNKQCIPITEGKIDFDNTLRRILSNKKKINHIVLSGGEPTCQNRALKFLFKLKEEGFKVKLDTNGTLLRTIKSLVEQGLIHYIAMDIKALPTPERYTEITGVMGPWDIIIKESVDYIKTCGIDYEFRSVFIPHFHTESEMNTIRDYLKVPEDKYIINEYEEV